MTDASARVPEQVDLLVRHGYLLTMDDEGTLIDDGAVAIRGRDIVAVGPDAEVAVFLSDAFQPPDPLQPDEVPWLEEAVLHVGDQVCPSRYRQHVAGVFTQKPHGFVHRRRPVVLERGKSQHPAAPGPPEGGCLRCVIGPRWGAQRSLRLEPGFPEAAPPEEAR